MQAETTLTFPENRHLGALFGVQDLHLAEVARICEIEIFARGNQIFLRGMAEGCSRAEWALRKLYGKLCRGQEIDPDQIRTILRDRSEKETNDPAPRLREPKERKNFSSGKGEIVLRKGSILARTSGQMQYLEALEREDLVLAMGPAGTGKTYLAVAAAVRLLEQGWVDRIILSRPALEAGERLGFLPGDLREKVDPYLRPLYDALRDLLGAERLECALKSGTIEIAPLAFMRGRTLSNAAILLDEAQNCTASQMKMFLTRMGENSRMVVVGDPSQTDLPDRQSSGLLDAAQRLKAMPGVALVDLCVHDVVRSGLVGRILRAYEEGTSVVEPQETFVVDVQIQDSRWLQDFPGIQEFVSDVVKATWDDLRKKKNLLEGQFSIEAGVILCDDVAICQWNRKYRGKDSPTNILSFPQQCPIREGTSGEVLCEGEGREEQRGEVPYMLGDLLLAYETIGREAAAEGKSLRDHVAHLLVHGVLHLCGYDHEDPVEAEAMEDLERSILLALSFSSP